jgi:hypothetical protein
MPSKPAREVIEVDDNLHLGLMKELYRLFDEANKHFKKDLKRPVITIQSAGKQKAEGWFAHDMWQAKGESIHEINICAESLAKGISQTVDTMLHEMAHLENFVKNDNKVVDCTDQQRHNLIFKKTAETYGLVVTSSKRYGFGHTDPSTDTMKWIYDDFKPDANLFALYRKKYNEIKDRKEKEKGPAKLAPVIISKDMKEAVMAGSKALGCDQKELTEKALKFYLYLVKTKPTSIPKEYRVEKSK